MLELLRGDRDVVRVGHRGAAALAPENTPAAIEAAAAHGVDVVELDVLRGAGGVLVLAHGPAVPADAPPLDSSTFELRYRYSRARRNARIRQRQENRLARFRFYIVMAVLVAIAIAFVVGAWHTIQHVFGI